MIILSVFLLGMSLLLTQIALHELIMWWRKEMADWDLTFCFKYATPTFLDELWNNKIIQKN